MTSEEPPSSPATTIDPPTSTTTAGAGAGGGACYLHQLVEACQRIVVPFLSTNDILRLSACSTTLKVYRRYLVKAKIVPTDHPSRAKIADLIGLLQDCSMSLKVLRISQSVINVLREVALAGCCKGIESLDLSGVELNSSSSAVIADVLLSQSFPCLQDLNLLGVWRCDNPRHPTSGSISLLGALAHGASSTNLTSLNLSSNTLGSEAAQVVASMITDGKCSQLRHLNLSYCELGRGGFVSIARAIGSGRTRNLRSLLVSKCLVVADRGEALATALRSGACPELEELGMGHDHEADDRGLIAVFEALEAKACPKIRWLDVVFAGLSQLGGSALARALSSGGCRQLEKLELYQAFADVLGQATMDCLLAIKACRRLRHLNLGMTHMGKDHAQALGDGLTSGCCSKLEDLVLWRNDCLAKEDGGWQHIALALEMGSCPSLRRLQLSKIGMGSAGADALSRAFSSGALASLEDIDLDDNPLIGDEAASNMIEIMASKCQRLLSLSAWNVGAGGETGRVVLTTLQDKAWPRLHSLSIMMEPSPACWACELGLILDKGAASSIQRLQVSCGVGKADLEALSQAFRHGACPAIKQLSLRAVVTEGIRSRLPFDELRSSLKDRAYVRCSVSGA